VNISIIALFLCIFVNYHLAYQYIIGTVPRPAAAAYTSNRPVTYHGDRRGSTTYPIAYYAHVWNINKNLEEV